jgi:hypothetical protein
MGRDDIKSKPEPGGFVKYGPEQLPKVDSMRRDKTLPDFYGVPILSDAQVLLTSADELNNKPASCYTCKEHTSELTCQRLGPGVKVSKIIGHRESGDPIEYWPCCGMHEYGNASGNTKYHYDLDTPATVGLVWINAPKTGQKFGGANCGGVSGGDDCDHYIVYGKQEKWDVDSAYCRILAHDVKGGQVCTAWHDDDELPYAEAQMLLRGDSLDSVDKKRLVKSIVGRSDSAKD